MVASPRRDRMDPTVIETHHLWSRCVRRAFLMGVDPLTGNDYSYRREWLESLIEYQASVFAVDIGTYNIMSNHVHQVLRNRPDIARTWDDEEVVWRWKMAWPQFDNGVWQAAPTDESIRAVLQQAQQDEHLIERIRANLCNLSWVQARIKQPFAWHVNRDEVQEARGHLWEQRYGNRRMDNDDETLTAILYNDLQQVKAGLVTTVEASDYSAIQRRIRGFAREAFAEVYGREPTDHDQDLVELEQLDAMFAHCFLAPIGDDGPLMTICETEVPAGELILPTGYTFAPGPDPPGADGLEEGGPDGADEEPATAWPEDATDVGTAASRADHRGSASADEQHRRRRPGRPRKRHARSIHHRLRARQRRRASRHAILGIPWEQYYDLLKQLEAQIVAERPRREEPSATPQSEVTAPPGSAHPRETPSTWRGQVKAFARWLQQGGANLPPHLSRPLRPSRGDPPDGTAP